jgi:pyrroline-5-carboxylate reductase
MEPGGLLIGESPDLSKANISMDLSQLTLGFVGTGKIGSAVARGFARCSPAPRIVVSPRSADKAAALLAEFPGIVTIALDNAEVVEKADVIFWGLLPGVAREELPALPFRPEHLIISMMAAIDYAETTSLAGVVPAANVVRTVPLPSAAKRSGPILMYPPHPRAKELLSFVGTCCECRMEDEMKPMISLTGHISAFYELERVSHQFMIANGVGEQAARDFVASFYSSLAQAALSSTDPFDELRDEAATPGGLNEQSVTALVASEHYRLHEQSLGSLLDRLCGRSK